MSEPHTGGSSVIVWIDDGEKRRAALPVRALELVAPGVLYPERIIKDFARYADGPVIGWSLGLRAFKVIPGSPPELTQPIEWERILTRLNALSMELDAEGLAREEPLKEHSLRDRVFEERARRILPAGVFVWLDEFQSAYHHHLEQMEEDRIDELELLILHPLLTTAERAEVIDGFTEVGNGAEPQAEAIIAVEKSSTGGETTETLPSKQTTKKTDRTLYRIIAALSQALAEAVHDERVPLMKDGKAFPGGGVKRISGTIDAYAL